MAKRRKGAWRQLSETRGILARIRGIRVDRRLPPTSAERAAIRKYGSAIGQVQSGAVRIVRPKTAKRAIQIIDANLGDVQRVTTRVLLVPKVSHISRKGEIRVRSEPSKLASIAHAHDLLGETRPEFRKTKFYYDVQGYGDYREHSVHTIMLPYQGRTQTWKVSEADFALLSDAMMMAKAVDKDGVPQVSQSYLTDLHVYDIYGREVQFDRDPQVLHAAMIAPHQGRAELAWWGS